MIPKVRRWRVKVHHPDGSITEHLVDTINKRFARWLARDRDMLAWWNRTKDTVSLAE